MHVVNMATELKKGSKHLINQTKAVLLLWSGFNFTLTAAGTLFVTFLRAILSRWNMLNIFQHTVLITWYIHQPCAGSKTWKPPFFFLPPSPCSIKLTLLLLLLYGASASARWNHACVDPCCSNVHQFLSDPRVNLHSDRGSTALLSCSILRVAYYEEGGGASPSEAVFGPC